MGDLVEQVAGVSEVAGVGEGRGSEELGGDKGVMDESCFDCQGMVLMEVSQGFGELDVENGSRGGWKGRRESRVNHLKLTE